eukprot:gnl/MRDRNA2_/MRDRNA2_106773_c0_seq1.p1 gnl/MRDRNA2_/MRDRNA2_106773_c0~~gnl/MRDRNA2_/MRDRNA2_106773_c0_seq1.p1  ORF type:complete len:213 (-),score=48.51 gnl/MRDRNA2_/MRDRNA2_106773_c0_seq1:80-718(-)
MKGAVPASSKDFLLACQKNCLEDVAEMLKSGVDASSQDPKTGLSALHHAAYHGNLKLCQLILDADVPVNPRDVGQLTPLHVAAAHDFAEHVEVVDLLCDNCADLAAVDSIMQAPLHWAVHENHLKTASSLLSWEGGPEVLRMSDIMERTPIDIARSLPGDEKKMLTLLLQEHPVRIPKKALPKPVQMVLKEEKKRNVRTWAPPSSGWRPVSR